MSWAEIIYFMLIFFRLICLIILKQLWAAHNKTIRMYKNLKLLSQSLGKEPGLMYFHKEREEKRGEQETNRLTVTVVYGNEDIVLKQHANCFSRTTLE